MVYFIVVLLVVGLSVISVFMWDFLFMDVLLVVGLGVKSIFIWDFVFFKGCLVSGWFKCYECFYMNRKFYVGIFIMFKLVISKIVVK